jgi:hypothetical protein
MGASDSKLVFKKGIFRLSEERHIPPSDGYWASVSCPSPSLSLDSLGSLALMVLDAGCGLHSTCIAS